ncbi:DUF5980 family protein [Plantactinospora sp. B6F1]|uniref:DUF5980 family protein n=1 Tax=Plantactinospora sp. B6F1 TaxID=3158971 RepID=UPI00102BE030
MKRSRTVLRIAATAVATMMIALVGGAAASAAPAPTTTGTPPSWTLVDVGQRLCATPDDPRTLYFFVVLDGTWSVPITASYTGMPAGTEVYSPLVAQPGSGDGHRVQIWAAFRLNGAPLGRYVPKLWAADGVVTQSVPVVLDIRSWC